MLGHAIPVSAGTKTSSRLFRSDRYRLPQAAWTDREQALIRRELDRQNVAVRRLSKEKLSDLVSISEAVARSGLPKYLLCVKLPEPLGYGVFLRPDAKPLARGALIGIYSGKVRIVPQHEPDDALYAFEPLSDVHLLKEEQLRWDPKRVYRSKRAYSVQVDAGRQGNFTRFINHSEEPNVRAELITIPKKQKGLAPSALEVLYMACRVIRPGEQLLVSYEGDDDSYWSALGIKPMPVVASTFSLHRTAGGADPR